MHVLALEVGVGFVRAAVLDTRQGLPVGGVARTEYTLDAPEPCAAEVPGPRLWDAVAAAGRTAVRLARVAGTPYDVAGVGLTAFMPGLVLLGTDDEPLGPIWTPRDRRARPAARQVNAHLGTEFLASIGSRPLPGGVSVLMFRQQLTADPYLCHRVRTYLHVGGWLALKLTGAKAFDPANASATGLFGTLSDQAWSPRWCKYFEVDREWLTGRIASARWSDEVLGVHRGPVRGGWKATCAAIGLRRRVPERRAESPRRRRIGVGAPALFFRAR
jgi:sugar (pentulose or hexulose) kinase